MPGFATRAKETVLAAVDDNIMGEAAKVSFYFFLALFPLILVLFALTGIVGGDDAFEWVMAELYRLAPPDTAEYLGTFVQQVTSTQRPGLFSVGLLLTLWAASNIFTGLADGLNSMYDIRDGRGFIKRRLLALALLVGAVFTLLGGVIMIMAGPQIVRFLGLGFVWEHLRWPLVFLLVVVQLWLIYYVLPARDQRGALRETLIGAIVGAALWLGATAAFQLYVGNFGAYDEMYGVLGGIIVLLLWMYISATAILFGGEVAANLEGRGGRGRRART